MQHTVILVTMSEWEAKRKKIRVRLVISILLTKKKAQKSMTIVL